MSRTSKNGKTLKNLLVGILGLIVGNTEEKRSQVRKRMHRKKYIHTRKNKKNLPKTKMISRSISRKDEEGIYFSCTKILLTNPKISFVSQSSSLKRLSL